MSDTSYSFTPEQKDQLALASEWEEQQEEEPTDPVHSTLIRLGYQLHPNGTTYVSAEVATGSC
jgi:hypothetical protein